MNAVKLKTAVILLAGGSGTRMLESMPKNVGECFRSETEQASPAPNKVFMTLAGKSVFLRSAEALLPFADELVVVCRKTDRSLIEKELAKLRESVGCRRKLPLIRTAEGGESRQASALNGIRTVSEDADLILIHDAARCLVDEGTIRRCIAAAALYGSGVAAIPVVDTVKTVGEAVRAENAPAVEPVCTTPPRAFLRAIQTPQCFRAELIRRAYEQAEQDGYTGTDDASLAEHLGETVRLTEGNRRNLKLTTWEDIRMARAFMDSASDLPDLRIGTGYDVHRLTEGRRLILCGVEVPHTMGLLGHSDADVALHALMDAMLGAMALGDIGKHFPDTDPQYKGISSMKLLAHTVQLLREKQARVANADITIVAQKPKLLPFIPQMRRNVADALGLPPDRVNVKATTTEHLGFEGEEKGISAQAVVTVQTFHTEVT